MTKVYDHDTESFMKQAITGAEMTQEVGTSRDPYLPPTQPQSTNVTAGNNAATYPKGSDERPAEGAERVSDSNKVESKIGSEQAKQTTVQEDLKKAKPYMAIASKLMQGGNPKNILAKAVVSGGIKALLQQDAEQQTKTGALIGTDVMSIYHKLNGLYGTAWHDWELNTISQTLMHDMGDHLSSDGTDVIGALQVIINTNQAHENWHVFEKVGHAFNGNVVDFSTQATLEPHECASTISIINQLRKNHAFDPEVIFYVAVAAKVSGMVYLPEKLFPMNSEFKPQDALNRLENDEHLAAAVKLRLESTNTSDSGQTPSTTEENQVKHLREIEAYVNERVAS